MQHLLFTRGILAVQLPGAGVQVTERHTILDALQMFSRLLDNTLEILRAYLGPGGLYRRVDLLLRGAMLSLEAHTSIPRNPLPGGEGTTG
jgi:hypothetical protein